MSSGPTQNYDDPNLDRWRPRPVLAAVVRLGVVALPAALAIAMGWAAATWFPADRLGLNPWVWLAGEITVATLLVLALGRLTRRLLPLSAMLAMALVFPDRAPSRLAVALRTHSPAALRRQIADVQARRAEPGTEPTTALLGLVAALSLHDHNTRGHSERVQAYTSLIAEEMGLPEPAAARLRWAALLHDIGKLRIPTPVLAKQGRPSSTEWEVLATHPTAGLELAAPLTDFLGEWAAGINQHHEHWNGAGYPAGLAGQQIHLGARIIAVADTYDVITSTRSYKDAMPASQARAELARCAGTQFDPAVVRAFLAVGLGKLRLATGPLSALTSLPGLRSVPLHDLATTAGGIGATLSTGAAAATATLGLLVGGLAAPAAADPLTASAKPPPPAAAHPWSGIASDARGASTHDPVDGDAATGPTDAPTEPSSTSTPEPSSTSTPEPSSTSTSAAPASATPAPAAPSASTAPATSPANCTTVTADERTACELAGATLVGDWSGLGLAGLDLHAATLRGVDLSGANLNAANLTSATLLDVDLTGARLQATSLSGATLDGVDLTSADLTNANLSGAHLTGTVFGGAVLTNADLLGTIAHDVVVLRDAELGGADLSGAVLPGADLRGANLAGSKLVGADLTGALLDGASLSRADATGTLLVGTAVTGTDLSRATLTRANLWRATGTPSSTAGATFSATVCPSGDTSSTTCW